MDLIFKITAGTPHSPAQVGDTDFQEHYSGVNRSMAWDELTPAIRQATQKFVLPFVGPELYDDLATKYNAGTALTSQQAQTLEYLQDCVAFYTIYHILPEKQTVVASMGVVQNAPIQGSQPTNQWSWKAKRWSALENGDAFLDKLLTYLEKQVADAVAYFDLWADSSAYNVKVSNFFRQTAQLDEYLNIKESRRSFISLVKYMRDVEEDVILPLLCTDQFEALKASDLDADGLALLAKVRKTVAFLGLYEAIPHHRIVIDGDGFRIVSQTDQFDSRMNLENTQHEAAITDLSQRAERKGRQYLAELRVFLKENEDTYTLWKNSTCNTATTAKSHSIIVSPDEIGGIGIF